MALQKYVEENICGKEPSDNNQRGFEKFGNQFQTYEPLLKKIYIYMACQNNFRFYNRKHHNSFLQEENS